MLELDDDTLERLKRFCGRDPREPEPITRTVFDESGTRYWAPADFLEEIAAAVGRIPADKLADATVELQTDYEEYGHLKITYEDVQTPDEVVANLEWCLGHIREEQRSERETYERLSAKYGTR
jgi:hypothetical protein